MSEGPPVHLMRDNEWSLVWCGRSYEALQADAWRDTDKHADATCLACLDAAGKFGAECRRRYRNLLQRTVP